MAVTRRSFPESARKRYIPFVWPGEGWGPSYESETQNMGDNVKAAGHPGRHRKVVPRVPAVDLDPSRKDVRIYPILRLVDFCSY